MNSAPDTNRLYKHCHRLQDGLVSLDSVREQRNAVLSILAFGCETAKSYALRMLAGKQRGERPRNYQKREVSKCQESEYREIQYF